MDVYVSGMNNKHYLWDLTLQTFEEFWKSDGHKMYLFIALSLYFCPFCLSWLYLDGIDLILSTIRSDDFHLLFSFDHLFVASLDNPNKLTYFVISSTKNKWSSFIVPSVHRLVKWVQHSPKKWFFLQARDKG